MTVATSTEYRIVGPPGTGKTTTASRLITEACQAYGSEQVLAASFTRTAARELVRRDLPMNEEQIGTLHALCYRMLDRPTIVSKSHLKDWNAEHPAWTFEGGAVSDLDDPYGDADAGGANEGDKIAQDYHRLRGLMIPQDEWPVRVQWFADAWQDFKDQTHTIDFTDLIATALRERAGIPNGARVFFLDEVQDFSPLELALARHWGQQCEKVYLLGDEDQTLYRFKGAIPDTFLSPVLPAEQVTVLSQSYRIPRAVHAAAVRWVEQIGQRMPKAYQPRQADGLVDTLPITYKYLAPIKDQLDGWLGEGKRVAFLASCAHFIDPVKHQLREWGVPFHNPYRRCSPPDEPILTDYGWVEIGKLDSSIHRLAGFHAGTNSLSWGGRWSADLKHVKPSGPHGNQDRRGFNFTVGARPYSGEMLTLTTNKSQTRVTPNHRIRARYTKEFFNKWAVYLMRKKQHWRIGISQTGSYPFKESGIAGRLTHERADGAWILSIHSSRASAMLEESALQIRYGITGLTFRKHPSEVAVFTQSDLDDHHENLSDVTPSRARQLLCDYHLEEESPLIIRDGKRRRRTGAAFETVAANLLTGYMALPVMPDDFEKLGHPRVAPEWHAVTVTRERYVGDVYSLDVPGPEHYISGRAIVHNSRGDWNPLAGRAGTVTAADRLLAFRKVKDAGQWWTYRELWAWAATLEADEVFARGAKTAMRRKAEDDATAGLAVEASDLESWMPGEDAADAATGGDVDWLRAKMLATYAKPMTYASAVLQARGPAALTGRPLVSIGTIHSYKGGEADVVVLFPDLSPAGYREWTTPGDAQDSVRRCFYVGMTRAREALYWAQPCGLSIGGYL